MTIKEPDFLPWYFLIQLMSSTLNFDCPQFPEGHVVHQAIVFSLANGHSPALMIRIISLLTVTAMLALLYFLCV
jgi:hypothetical protein